MNGKRVLNNVISQYSKMHLLSLTPQKTHNILDEIHNMTNIEKTQTRYDIHRSLCNRRTADTASSWCMGYAATFAKLSDCVTLVFDSIKFCDAKNLQSYYQVIYECKFIHSNNFEISLIGSVLCNKESVINVASTYQLILDSVVSVFMDTLIEKYPIRSKVQPEVHNILLSLQDLLPDVVYAEMDGLVFLGNNKRTVILERLDNTMYMRTNKTSNIYKRFELSNRIKGI